MAGDLLRALLFARDRDDNLVRRVWVIDPIADAPILCDAQTNEDGNLTLSRDSGLGKVLWLLPVDHLLRQVIDKVNAIHPLPTVPYSGPFPSLSAQESALLAAESEALARLGKAMESDDEADIIDAEIAY